jgi:hypothetical protein
MEIEVAMVEVVMAVQSSSPAQLEDMTKVVVLHKGCTEDTFS